MRHGESKGESTGEIWGTMDGEGRAGAVRGGTEMWQGVDIRVGLWYDGRVAWVIGTKGRDGGQRRMETEMRKGNRGRKYSLFEKQNGKWVRMTPNAYHLATARQVWQTALLAAAFGGGNPRCLKPAERVEICGPTQAAH